MQKDFKGGCNGESRVMVERRHVRLISLQVRFRELQESVVCSHRGISVTVGVPEEQMGDSNVLVLLMCNRSKLG